jgi:tetratricopeptide (TPR) repeat protein
MPLADRYGLPVTTASARALEHFQDGMDRLLAFGPGAEDAFAAALREDERLAVAHAGVALHAVAQGDAATARAATGRAREAVAGGTRRERQHVEALEALVAGETTRGLALVDAHVAEFPRDALLVNQASSAIGFAGGADREQSRMAFLERLAPAYGDDWWFQSALAFTYHEVGHFEASRRLSERALRAYPGNANASHNLAHIYFETVDHDGGAAFLDDWLRGYDRRASFHCHLAWHLAMFELHRGRHLRAREIFARDILGAANPRLAMIDGAALLWRLRLDDLARVLEEPGAGGRGHAGSDHDGRRSDDPDDRQAWRALADLAGRVSRPGFVFGEVHAALAYAACGDEAALARLIDGLRALDAKGHPIAGTVARPLVQGIAAFVAGDHAAALAHFEPVEGEMHRVGGSHAQWEIFEETMVASYLLLERYDGAGRLMRRRLTRRASPRDLRWRALAREDRA